MGEAKKGCVAFSWNMFRESIKTKSNYLGSLADRRDWQRWQIQIWKFLFLKFFFGFQSHHQLATSSFQPRLSVCNHKSKAGALVYSRTSRTFLFSICQARKNCSSDLLTWGWRRPPLNGKWRWVDQWFSGENVERLIQTWLFIPRLFLTQRTGSIFQVVQKTQFNF